MHPILSVEPAKESPAFTPVRKTLENLLDSLKASQAITQASVYLREFDQGDWICLNPREKYHPASLMKVALLISYLRVAQSNADMLKETLLFDKPDSVVINPQFYAGPSIQPGKQYTIHELLYYMIAYSDNNATWLLSQHIDNNQLKTVFADVGLPEPLSDDLKFTMTTQDISVFFKIIFNSTYLSPEYSEYAAQLMGNCSFHDGFVRGLPENTRIWHKFGEWRSAGHDFELHEAGVLFIKDKPYLLTVMTRGKDTTKLAQAIGAIANKVYIGVSGP